MPSTNSIARARTLPARGRGLSALEITSARNSNVHVSSRFRRPARELQSVARRR